jgi:hypothetical protein
MGWRRTTQRILATLAASASASIPDAQIIVPGTDGTLAHAAALCGGWAVSAVADAGGEAAGLGSASLLGVRSAALLTPLHFAARSLCTDALFALTSTPAGIASWFISRDGGGRCARDALCAAARTDAVAAAALDALDALHLQCGREATALLRAAQEVLGCEHGMCSPECVFLFGAELLRSDPSLQALRALAPSPAALLLAIAMFEAHARKLFKPAAASADHAAVAPPLEAAALFEPATSTLTFSFRRRLMRSRDAKRMYALCSMAGLSVFRYVFCAGWRSPSLPPLSDDVIRAAMPFASWEVWVRLPTASCAHGAPNLQHVRAAVAVCATLAVVLVLSPGTLPRSFRRRYAAGACAALATYGLLIEPICMSVATHLEYGLGLRQPWQAGMRQLLMTSMAHACTEGSLPPRTYAGIMFVRGLVPLLARVAELCVLAGVGGNVAWGLASARLLPQQRLWDVVHALLCAACVVHHLAMRAQLPKEKEE